MVRVSQEIFLKLGNIYSHIPPTPEPFDVVERKREEMDRHKEQEKIFRQNEAVAKSIIESIPKETAFLIKERSDDSPSGEISYNVFINKLDDKKLFYEVENTFKVKSSNYLGFCLHTRLMIRDDQGKTIPNQELIDRLVQNNLDHNIINLPQTRQNAA
jgi:hypothetical protein